MRGLFRERPGHLQAVLLHLHARLKTRYKKAVERGPEHAYVVPDPARESLRLEGSRAKLPRSLSKWFEANGVLGSDHTPEELLEHLRAAEAAALRVS